MRSAGTPVHGPYPHGFPRLKFDTQDRIANVRANLGFQNSVSLMATMAGSWRLIDSEAWAVAAPKKAPIGELTTRRSHADDSPIASRWVDPMTWR
jgi:hypothetical protein